MNRIASAELSVWGMYSEWQGVVQSCQNMSEQYGKKELNRVILNGQIWVRRGRGAGVAQAWGRSDGHNGHNSLKFEKDGWLYERASGAPKTFTDKNLRKSAQGGAWKSKKRTPSCARGFCLGINIILSVVAHTYTLTLWWRKSPVSALRLVECLVIITTSVVDVGRCC